LLGEGLVVGVGVVVVVEVVVLMRMWRLAAAAVGWVARLQRRRRRSWRQLLRLLPLHLEPPTLKHGARFWTGFST
jgi:hypothetical protein